MRSQSGFGYVVRFLQISYSLSCPFLSFVLVLVFVFILDIRAINLLKCFWLSMLPCVYAITVAIAYCYSNSSKVQHLFIRLEQFGFVDFEMENCVCLCIFFIIFFGLFSVQLHAQNVLQITSNEQTKITKLWKYFLIRENPRYYLSNCHLHTFWFGFCFFMSNNAWLIQMTVSVQERAFHLFQRVKK